MSQSKELVVSSTAHETKLAILEDDELVEIYFERERQYSLAGSIYKGRVTRVLPGMQSAFVNIGLERDAFLYVSDFVEDTEEYDRVAATVEEKVVRMEERRAGGEEASAEKAPEQAAEGVAASSELEAEEPPQPPAPRPAPRFSEPRSEERWGQGGPPGGRPFRRGRSSRGRGPRPFGGRGFPDSKYASRPESFRGAPPLPREQPAPRGGDFEVLPGESLAKHGQRPPEPPVEPLAESTVDIIVAAAAGEAAPIETEEPVLPPLEAAVAEPEEAPDEIVEQPAAEPLEEAAVAAAAAAEPAAAPRSGTIEEADEPQPSPEVVEAAREAAVRERVYGYRPYVQHGPRQRRQRRGEFRERRPPERRTAPPERPREETPAPRNGSGSSITDLLKEGQEIIVQIAKEPIGKKGARITSHIALPGRYLVYMPTVDHVGVSRKVYSDEERQRLKKIVAAHRVGMTGGFIVRTAGEGQTEEEIRSDMDFLYNLWLDMRQKAERSPAPSLIHHDLSVVERVLRDQLAETFKTMWVDGQEDYERIVRFVERFQPELAGKVKLYTRSTPIFDEFGITPELEKALRPKVWLKSGGYIVINQTEALVAIDINTGKYVGKSNRLEDTIVKTNVDAIQEIVRQIRLRDLGGIIVVDFIDMDERKNRQKVMQALDEALRRDRSPSKALQFNDFGLVAITRKRVRQSLERTLCCSCPYCDGSGFVKSVHTMVQEILAEAKKQAGGVERRDVTLRVNPEVAKVLKSRSNNYLEEIETTLGRPVLVRSDPLVHQEKFDLH